MPKVLISDKGFEQKTGGGVEVKNSLNVTNELGVAGAVYSNGETVTAAVTTGPQLTSSLIQNVTAGTHDHRVSLPLAEGAGQLMIIRNVGGTYRIDVRNNANDADILNPLQAGKVALCYSTAAGDNWVGSQLD
jgi:hypothetical protein